MVIDAPETIPVSAGRPAHREDVGRSLARRPIASTSSEPARATNRPESRTRSTCGLHARVIPEHRDLSHVSKSTPRHASMVLASSMTASGAGAPAAFQST